MDGLTLKGDCFEAFFKKLEEAPDFNFHKTEFKKLADTLGIEPDFVNSLRESLVTGAKSYTEIIYAIIQRWIEENGRNAKLENLYLLLTINGWSKITDFLNEEFKYENYLKPRRPDLASFYEISTAANSPISGNGKITYFPNKILGRGSLGTTVYRGRWEQRDVAVKEIICKSKEEKRVISELNALLDCQKHENVVKYYCKESVPGPVSQVFLALELCDLTLQEWITTGGGDKGMGRSIPVKVRVKIDPISVLHQTTLGLAHLHEKGIIHRDIKPANILLLKVSSSETRVKISDFGISRRIPIDRTCVTLNTNSGTVGWKAPEILEIETDGVDSIKENHNKPKSYMSRATDIFSLGCVFYYVLTNGSHPFGDNTIISQANVLQYLPQIQAEKLDVLHLGFLRLIFMMIAKDPSRRPPASAILKHHIFWSPKTNLQFIIDISNSQERFYEGSAMDLCTTDLENSPLLKPYCFPAESGGWFRFLCLEVQNFGGRKRSYDGELVQDLLRLIRNIHNHYPAQLAKRPEMIKALGSLSNEFLDYWLKRFPFVVDCSWMKFERMKMEEGTILRDYFCNEFYFNGVELTDQQEKVFKKFVRNQCLHYVLNKV